MYTLYYNMDYYQRRYKYEKTFKYPKFITLDEPYKEHTELGTINLVIQTYPIQRPEKLEELLLCLHNNLNNKCIKKVYNLYEDNIDFLPECIKNNKKLVNIKIDNDPSEYIHTYVPDFNKIKNGRTETIVTAYNNGGIDENTDVSIFQNNIKDRLTWNYFIDFCLKIFNDGEIVCLANADIIVEDSHEWYDVSNFLNERGALCLSRHEIDKHGNVFIDFNAFKCWSQDCWVFKNTEKMRSLKSKIDFSIGNCMGCDNAIAGIASACNYIPINYAFKYRVFHLDRVTKQSSIVLVLSRTHDNRVIENGTLLPLLFVCPFFNYQQLMRLPIPQIIKIITTNNRCGLKDYHEH
jgi:hypothetical protein